MTARSSERASVLMLMPAAVLIVVVLGAIAVDRAVIFGAQRELVHATQAAANDAAAVGLDLEDLRRYPTDPGDLHLDARRVETAVRAAFIDVDGIVDLRWHVQGDQIEVVASRRVDLVFSEGVPSAPDRTVVHARARAELRRAG